MLVSRSVSANIDQFATNRMGSRGRHCWQSFTKIQEPSRFATIPRQTLVSCGPGWAELVKPTSGAESINSDVQKGATILRQPLVSCGPGWAELVKPTSGAEPIDSDGQKGESRSRDLLGKQEGPVNIRELQSERGSVLTSEEFFVKGGVIKTMTTQSSRGEWFAATQHLVRTLWDQHRESGVRLDSKTLMEGKVVRPILDSQLQPQHRVLSVVAGVSEPTDVSLCHSGAAKASFNGPAELDGCQYGEDVACGVIIFECDGFRVHWLFGADGHGGRGSCTARLLKEKFQQVWTQLAPQVCKLTVARQFDEATHLLDEQGYQVVIPQVEQEAEMHSWTGSTVVQMLTVTTPEGSRIAYTSNIGDSVALNVVLKGCRASTGPKVYLTSVAHNWDDEDEIKRYTNHVFNVREAARLRGDKYEHITPSNVCYHHFNCEGSAAILEDIAGNQPTYDTNRRKWVAGDAQPIKMWKFEKQIQHDKLVGWDVKLDTVALEHVWQKARDLHGPEVIGGVQGPNKELFVVGSNEKPFRPVAPHLNWGSCVLIGNNRGCQITRGVADFKDRLACHTSSQASFMNFELLPDEEVVQVVMSDGVSDSVGSQALAEHIAGRVEDETNPQTLAESVIEFVKLNLCSRQPFKVDASGKPRPRHDDCSVATAHLTPNKATASY